MADKGEEKDVLDATGSGDKTVKDNINKAKDSFKTLKKVFKGIGKFFKFLWNIPFAGPIIVGVILVIIIIIGIYGFFTTIPGLMMAKIKEIAQGFWDWTQNLFSNAAYSNVNNSDIVDLANYLEEMEYDLVGYGFIEPSLNNTTPTYEDLTALGYQYGAVSVDDDTSYSAYYLIVNGNKVIYDGNYYDTRGVLMDNNTGEVVDKSTYYDQYGVKRSADSDDLGTIKDMGRADDTLLRTYLLQDYRIYVIKNRDVNTWHRNWETISSVFGGASYAWAKGMTMYYYADTDSLATEAQRNGLGIQEKIKISGKTLKIRNGAGNSYMDYSMEGWSDRYGTSLEFLLSLHLATGQPDLVYALIQSFDTEVQVYLQDSNNDDTDETATVEAAYVDLVNEDATELITWDEVQKVGEENDVDFGYITKTEAQTLFKNIDELTSPDNCTGVNDDFVIEKSTYGGYNLAFIGLTEEEDEDFYDTVDTYESDKVDYIGVQSDGSMDNYTEFSNTIAQALLGTDNEELKNEDYTFFQEQDIEELGLGYGESTIKSSEETEEFDTNTEADYSDDPWCIRWLEKLANKIASNSYNYYHADKVKQVKTWECVIDDGTDDPEEDRTVKCQWISYKYLLYYTGTHTDRNGDSYTDPEWIDTVVVEFVVRDKTKQEKIDSGILDEDGNPVEQKCSEMKDDNTTKCCKNCRKYVARVVKALKKINDDEYDMYTPYIARVLGSWFRDTYFVIPVEKDQAITDYEESVHRTDLEMQMIANSYGSNETNSYVTVDDEYLTKTGDYWTAYEMIDTDGDGEDDDYQLYYLNPDGTTSEEKMEDYLVKENYLSSTDVTEDELEEAKKEAEEDGLVFVKKAITVKSDDIKNSDDETLNLDSSKIVWSAYEIKSDGRKTGWIKIDYSEDDDTKNDYVNKVYDFLGDDGVHNDNGGFFYNMSTPNYVKQQEDAQRSETNPTIKWLFKYRKYYIYDGTTSKALNIKADKDAVLDAVQKFIKNIYSNNRGDIMEDLGNYGRSALREKYSSSFSLTKPSWDDITEEWLEWQLDMYYSGCTNGYGGFIINDETEWTIEVTDDNGESFPVTRYGDPRDPDLIGTTEITKTSLDAFSILENTKTLAAEYSYRDFKELIVELDYFDKEDFSDKVDSVFSWLIPDMTISGWPTRPWDKQDVDYGALIESEATYEYLRSVDYDPDSSDEEESTDTTQSSETQETETTDTETDEGTESEEEGTETERETINTDTEFEGYDGTQEEGELVASPVTGKVIEYDTHERTNIYTGATEKVGYITIEVLGSGELFTKDNVSNNSNDEDIDNEDIANGYNLFFDEYEGVCDSYTIMIDGFKIDSSKDVTNVTDDEGNNGKYTVNEVTPLYDKSEQTKREDEEDAKGDAPFWINVDGDLYIKEGKYIGRTYSDAEQESNSTSDKNPVIVNTTVNEEGKSEYTYYDGPANYMRIIVTAVDGSNIDNVEEYFKMPSTNNLSNGQSSVDCPELSAITDESSPEDKELAAMKYFISQGFSEAGAAGIVGNLMKENTALDPKVVSSQGYTGLAQWSTSRWGTVSAWLADNAYNPDSFEGQIRAIYESGDSGMTDALWNELKMLSDPIQAAELFCVYYENPITTNPAKGEASVFYKIGKLYQGLDERKSNAEKVLELYSGN